MYVCERERDRQTDIQTDRDRERWMSYIQGIESQSQTGRECDKVTSNVIKRCSQKYRKNYSSLKLLAN